MNETVNCEAPAELLTLAIKRRRDFHHYAETAWTEFRTASIVATTLTKLGYEVQVGDDVIQEAAMMGVPSEQELAVHMQRAIDQGADPAWVEKMRGGKTGVVGSLKFDREGPTVAMRFDMDANDLIETTDADHRPFREGFASVNFGAMHGCGHDGHTAVGLAIAQLIATMKQDLSGCLKIIFQPAEEGVRGAKAMVGTGIVDDVDYFLGMHFGFQAARTGMLVCQTTGFLATTKLDAVFTGVPAHAGAAPEAGRNALLAAATATLQLHAISRHSGGTSRINVGLMQGGSGRNVIPAEAIIKLETRGLTTVINDYMQVEAKRIIEAAALMQGVSVKITAMGGASGCRRSDEFAKVVAKVASQLGIFDRILPEVDFGASEDATYFMERVQSHGGQACYLLIGSSLAAGHHDNHFDFDEQAISNAIKLLSQTARDILA
jgi:aminobenzoyl-glutamate utilization protein A